MNAKRLQKEIIQLQDESLKNTGIYYFIEEENMTKATAFMFGPKDTPYEFCPLEYTFTIPDDYPFTPPKILYRTNDGKTRFHPNFYIDGKVCLSILGTYSGPKWASSMNISTVLLSIYSLITENPLVHEPAYENTRLTTPKNQQYANYIEHQMIQLFFKSIKYNYYNKYMDRDERFKNKILENYEILKKKVEIKTNEHDVTYTLLPYSMLGSTAWKNLYNLTKNEKN